VKITLDAQTEADIAAIELAAAEANAAAARLDVLAIEMRIRAEAAARAAQRAV
jgi:hypothetical protein